eukprot:7585296-Pyramimonas_sp.AAC.1
MEVRNALVKLAADERPPLATSAALLLLLGLAAGWIFIATSPHVERCMVLAHCVGVQPLQHFKAPNLQPVGEGLCVHVPKLWPVSLGAPANEEAAHPSMPALDLRSVRVPHQHEQRQEPFQLWRL